ncbi:hypothetical protein TNCV_3256181 [Trichonephila clavipes]|nr:hypothetical protein TNCV_3256181 [Trichonephila clavipes]
MRTETVETFELVKVKQKLLDIRAEKRERKENARALAVETKEKEKSFRTDVRTLQRKISMRSTKDQLVEKMFLCRFSSGLHGSTAADSVRSEWPLWHAAKKQNTSLRAQAQLMRTETVETFELVKVKQKLLDIRAEKERERRTRERDLIRVVEDLDGTVESTDTIAKLKTKIEKSSTFESDADFVKTLIKNCIDERVSAKRKRATLEKQKIELAKLQLAQLEKEVELQTAKNEALSLNPAAKVEEKQLETNIENMIQKH